MSRQETPLVFRLLSFGIASAVVAGAGGIFGSNAMLRSLYCDGATTSGLDLNGALHRTALYDKCRKEEYNTRQILRGRKHISLNPGQPNIRLGHPLAKSGYQLMTR